MLPRTVFFALIFLLALGLFAERLTAEELTLKQTGTGYEVFIGENIFAGYLTDFRGTPVLYPIVGPTGKHMTRDFPWQEGYPGMRRDHAHHRSFWFAHGSVNGIDFWNASAKIVHKRFIKAECDGQTALIVTENDWMTNDGQHLCSDVRTFRFSVSGDKRVIDFDVTVTAAQERVLFGDTKEGIFGLRVPETIGVEVREGTGGGRFVNAEGKVGELNAQERLNEEAWGKRSAWVSYYGKLDGETVGIAILNHPSSFRFPTYWHVRGYGLFAANPFGITDFESLATKQAGDLLLSKGESFTLRYRVLFHKGGPEEAKVAEAYQEYAEQK